MTTNIDKFKKDLERLVDTGYSLHLALVRDCYPDELKEQMGEKFDEHVKKLPVFSTDYQAWYSESMALIKQLLPDRLDDFTMHYKKSKSRIDITTENYRIEDYLQGSKIDMFNLTGTRLERAIPHFKQQLAILKSVEKRFDSSLFDIRQIVQSDLFDSAIDASRELAKKGFLRGAGAIAGVVLEKHLAQVLKNHNIKIRKKHPSINDFNELLKNGGILDAPEWRKIQQLGDVRNLCVHNSDREPNKEEVLELIEGVEKFTKTLY